MKPHFYEYDHNTFLTFRLTSNAICHQFSFRLPSNYCLKITEYSHVGIFLKIVNEKNVCLQIAIPYKIKIRRDSFINIETLKS